MWSGIYIYMLWQKLHKFSYNYVKHVVILLDVFSQGANNRNLSGVLVGTNNKAKLDPLIVWCSGKPLVPDYALSFFDGKSTKPFGRLWWDKFVHTVVTEAEPHNQCILHPGQDRVLAIRENARLQGFCDWYKLCGDVKERYMFRNAVAFSVSMALGQMLAKASKGVPSNEPVTEIPVKFPSCLALLLERIKGSHESDDVDNMMRLCVEFIQNSLTNQ